MRNKELEKYFEEFLDCVNSMHVTSVVYRHLLRSPRKMDFQDMMELLNKNIFYIQRLQYELSQTYQNLNLFHFNKVTDSDIVLFGDITVGNWADPDYDVLFANKAFVKDLEVLYNEIPFEVLCGYFYCPPDTLNPRYVAHTFGEACDIRFTTGNFQNNKNALKELINDNGLSLSFALMKEERLHLEYNIIPKIPYTLFDICYRMYHKVPLKLVEGETAK